MPAPRASPSTFTTVVVRSLQGENRQVLQSMPPGATRGRTHCRPRYQEAVTLREGKLRVWGAA